jgi:hypothetical protein
MTREGIHCAKDVRNGPCAIMSDHQGRILRSITSQVAVPCIPAADAALVFGAGVGMVVAAGKGWLQLFIRVHRSHLEARVCHLNHYWRESGRGQRFGIEGLRFNVSSLAEVGSELLALCIPGLTGVAWAR